MSNVILEIPEEFARSFGTTDEQAAQNVKIELAISMYHQGKWSTGKAAKFAGIYIGDFMDLLRDRNVPYPYTREMLESDLKYALGSG
jgi:predicted HTH domain antitoxin